MVASMARRFVLSVAVVLAGCGEALPPGGDLRLRGHGVGLRHGAYDCCLTWPRFDGDAGVVDVDWQTMLLPPLTTLTIPVRASATDTFRVNVAHQLHTPPSPRSGRNVAAAFVHSCSSSRRV